MNWRQAYNHWTNSRYSRVSTEAAFKAGFEAGQAERQHLEPGEHAPTLEGVIEYLENQNDLAFLAYRTIERGSEPGMHASVRARLLGDTYMVWQGVGDALNKAREAAKLNTESIIAR